MTVSNKLLGIEQKRKIPYYNNFSINSPTKIKTR